MGSKKLRAVAVRGTKRPPVADLDTVNRLAKWFRDNYMETSSGAFAVGGTMRLVRVFQETGGLPTRNFQQGQFEGFEGITAEAQMEQITVSRDTCFGCPVRCKWIVEVNDREYRIDRKYGGPEYETAGAMGCLCGIGDIRAVAAANQFCNANGLDTIGAGATIAFAMECFERGLIGPQETDGIELRFGNAQALLEMLQRMVRRKGFGDVLADGSRHAAERIGGNAWRYAVQIKGQEVAMHDPRIKYGHGLGIAVSPTGADHMHSLHDNLYQTEGGIQGLKPLGVLEPLPYDDLSAKKIHLVRQTIIWRVTYNLTGICMFHGWSPQQVAELISATTGWNTSVLELWLAAERAYNMARAFNVREGFGPEDDLLPPRLMEPLAEGPMAGKVYTEEAFRNARDKFYGMMGWDVATGMPTRAKLENLDLGWVADLFEEK